jgi:hypothetical protein
MKKGGEGDKELPPSPSKGNGYGCKITPIDGTPKGSHVEQLSSEFKQLKLQRKIDKLKESKSCEVASSSLSNEETDASSEEAKDKKGKKGDKRSYNNAFFNYDNLPHFNAFP